MKAGLDPRSGQTPSLNTGSDSSIAKGSAGSSEMTLERVRLARVTVGMAR